MRTCTRLLLCILASLACHEQRETPDNPIVLRGVSFRVPAKWVLEWEPDSVAVMSPPDNLADALRVSVLVAVGVPSDSILRTLADGAHLTTNDTVVVEASEQLSIRNWQVSQLSAPDTLRVVVVSMAQRASTAPATAAARLSAADNLVRALEFPRRP